MLALGGKAERFLDVVLRGDGKLRPLRESLGKAGGLLEAAGPALYKANNSISRQNQSIPQMAAGVAGKTGIPVNDLET